MRLTLAIFFGVCLTCCNLGEKVANIKRINADLSETFGHEHINTSVGWGTEQEDNHVQVTFSKYDVDSVSYNELKAIAASVTERLRTQNPDFRNANHIEVRFTKEEGTEDLTEFVVFKHKNE